MLCRTRSTIIIPTFIDFSGIDSTGSRRGCFGFKKKRDNEKKNQVMWCRTKLQFNSQQPAAQRFNRLRHQSTVCQARQLFLFEILVSAPLTTLYYSKVDLNTNLKTLYFSTSTARILGKGA